LTITKWANATIWRRLKSLMNALKKDNLVDFDDLLCLSLKVSNPLPPRYFPYPPVLALTFLPR
ncbi:hypothetical protein, partial [Helicobacter pylori]|uniref:hypothetical protein n=1 Tax=Helicobacter pylori TaxID=210 RepID=UPI001C7DF800